MENHSYINNQFIPYKLALKLKELGFDEECFKVYDELGFIQDEKKMDELNLIKLNAPLWQQAGNFLYICSNKKINVSINGSDTYEELCEKFEKAISNFRDLQNNKSKR